MATNVFDLFAKISLDSSGYEKGLNTAKKTFDNIANGIGTAVKTITAVSATAIGAGATAIGTIAKQSLDNYSEYEQLAGGVETLFKGSADKVKAYADEAYRTAGMDSNKFMENAVNFSAALISSLEGDTDKAADQVNKAIIDMSDNVNKFGSDAEAVENAYRGFSRGEFTMLDNLKLGFAGTKTGMQELLDKAHEISGVEFNIDSYSDIIDAIHVIQEDFGITGATSAEAATTIEGSTKAMKSSWENMLTEIGKDNADIPGVFGILLGSGKANLSNMLPRVKTIGRNIGKLSVTVLAEINKALRSESDGDNNIISELISIGEEYLPSIKHFAGRIVSKLKDDLKEKVDSIDFKQVGEKISGFIQNGLEGISDFVGGIDWVEVGEDIGDFLNGIDWKGIFDSLFEILKTTLKAGGNFITRLVGTLEPETVAVATGFLFAKNMISKIAGSFLNPEGDIATSFGNAKTNIKALFAPIGSESGASFGTAFSAALDAFLVGYSIGSWVYDKWGDQIDSAVWSVMDRIRGVMGDGEAEESEETYLEKAMRRNPNRWTVGKYMLESGKGIGDMQSYAIERLQGGFITAEQFDELMKAVREAAQNPISVTVDAKDAVISSDEALENFVHKLGPLMSAELESERTRFNRAFGGAGY